MLKYLPATFGLAVLIASTALAEDRSAQKQFVNHNNSMMLMQIGDASGDMSTLRILLLQSEREDESTCRKRRLVL